MNEYWNKCLNYKIESIFYISFLSFSWNTLYRIGTSVKFLEFFFMLFKFRKFKRKNKFWEKKEFLNFLNLKILKKIAWDLEHTNGTRWRMQWHILFLSRRISCETNRKCVDTSCDSCADYRVHFRSRSLENYFSEENALKRWKRGHWFPLARPRRWCDEQDYGKKFFAILIQLVYFIVHIYLNILTHKQLFSILNS